MRADGQVREAVAVPAAAGRATAAAAESRGLAALDGLLRPEGQGAAEESNGGGYDEGSNRGVVGRGEEEVVVVVAGPRQEMACSGLVEA